MIWARLVRTIFARDVISVSDLVANEASTYAPRFLGSEVNHNVERCVAGDQCFNLWSIGFRPIAAGVYFLTHSAMRQQNVQPQAEPQTVKRVVKPVYTVVAGKDSKKYWHRIGTFFENADGSQKILLVAAPINGELIIQDREV